MAEEKGSSRTIKVVDRRRFTTDGDPREDVPPAPDPAQGVTAPPTKPADSSREAPPSPPQHEARTSSAAGNEPPASQGKSSPATSSEFVELIASLAQQAEILLLGAEGVPAEPDHARRIIDYLAVLESKTAGNLSSEEQQILSSVIFQLRSLFVQRR